MAHSGMVYKISYQDCDAAYVGQTKRQLKICVDEHSSDIRKKCGSPSGISIHRMNNNHNFDWKGVQILDNEKLI